MGIAECCHACVVIDDPPIGADPTVVGVPDALVPVDGCSDVQSDALGCFLLWNSVRSEAEVLGPAGALSELHVDARLGHPTPARHWLEVEFIGG